MSDMDPEVDPEDPRAAYAAYLRDLRQRELEQHERRSRADARWLRVAACLAGAFVVLLWLIWVGAEMSGVRLYPFGINPGSIRGLVGVLTAPFLHGSLEHLVSNTLPLLVLGTALIYIYPASARTVLLVIWLGGGLAVWLFARPSHHIGASGVVYGMMAFLLVAGLLRRDRRSIAVSMIVFFLYGSMIWGVFPGEPGVSFESHLAGAVLGVVLAIVFRKRDPVQRRPLYQYELEEAMEGKAFVTDDDGPPRLH